MILKRLLNVSMNGEIVKNLLNGVIGREPDKTIAEVIMKYIWESGKKRRTMHIMKFSKTTGEPLMTALCEIDHKFNRSINAPFALGLRICKRCEKIAKNDQGFIAYLVKKEV